MLLIRCKRSVWKDALVKVFANDNKWHRVAGVVGYNFSSFCVYHLFCVSVVCGDNSCDALLLLFDL